MIRRLAAGLALGVVLTALGGLTGTAEAKLLPPSSPPSSDPTPNPDSGTPTYGTVKNCAIVSSSTYLGMSCAGSDHGGKTVKQILGSSDVPGCWDEPLSDAELVAMNVHNEPGPDGWTYYWEKCLTGIDPKTKTIGPDGIAISVGLLPIHNGDPIKTLDSHQQELVDGLRHNENIPVPIAGVSPTDHARVGGDVSFFDGTRGLVQVAVGSVLLRARVESIDIEPLGAGRGAMISCAGTGLVAHAGDTRESRPEGCWYRYLHSSAGQQMDQYPVQITAHWTVESSADGGATFTLFNRFTRSGITRVRVTEVQTLVVQ